MHMMTVVDIDNEIKRLLTWMIVYVGGDNSMGQTDVNIYSEDFLVPLMNEVWGCDFKNLNTLKYKNYPGIDLGDDEKRIAVQVTSTVEREKIVHTIKQFENKVCKVHRATT